MYVSDIQEKFCCALSFLVQTEAAEWISRMAGVKQATEGLEEQVVPT